MDLTDRLTPDWMRYIAKVMSWKETERKSATKTTALIKICDHLEGLLLWRARALAVVMALLDWSNR
jgi:hypothetical protein